MNNTDAATILYKYILKDAEETMKSNKEISIETLPLETMKENAFFKMHIAAMEEYAAQFKAEQKQSAGNALWETQLCLQTLINRVRQSVNKNELTLNEPFQKAFDNGLYIIKKYSNPTDALRIKQSDENQTPQKQLSDEYIIKDAFDAGYDYRTSLLPEIIAEFGENSMPSFDEWIKGQPETKKQLSDEEIENVMLKHHHDFIHLDSAQYRIVRNTFIKGYKAALNDNTKQ